MRVDLSRSEFLDRASRYQNQLARGKDDPGDRAHFDRLRLDLETLPGASFSAMEEAARQRDAAIMTACGPHRVTGGWLKILGVTAAVASLSPFLPALPMMALGAVSWSAGTFLVDRGVRAAADYRRGWTLADRLQYCGESLPSNPSEKDTGWLQPSQVRREELLEHLEAPTRSWLSGRSEPTLDKLYLAAQKGEQHAFVRQEAAKILSGLGTAAIVMGFLNPHLGVAAGLVGGLGAKFVAHQLQVKPGEHARELARGYSQLAAEASRYQVSPEVLSRREVERLSERPSTAVGETDDNVTLAGVSLKKREKLTDNSPAVV